MKKILSFICSVCVAVSAISLPFLIGKGNEVCALSSSESFYTYESSLEASYVSISEFPFTVYDKSHIPVVCIQYGDYVLFCDDAYIPDGVDITCSVSVNAPWVAVSFKNTNNNTNYNYNTAQYRGSGDNWSFYYFASNTTGDVLYVGSDTPQIYLNKQFFTDPTFSSEFEVVPLPFFSLEVDSFYDWIINNNKLSELPTYIVQAKLKSFLEFYKQFGSSNAFFISKIPLWFAHMNIANQSISNISALKSSIDKLYQEYINYRSGTHAYWPGATKIQERDTIDTKTDNNDLFLVTDDNNDPLDISILRDILRGVIAISNNVNQGCANIVQKLDELNFIVNVVNDGGDSSPIDFSSLYTYDSDAFADDLQTFETNLAEVQNIPQGYIDTINQNSLMPENMLSDKNSLTVNVPCITGFSISNNGSSYSTQTGTYTLSSSDYPWLDSVVQKIKRFASILLIIGYLVHLRYRIPELVRGE